MTIIIVSHHPTMRMSGNERNKEPEKIKRSSSDYKDDKNRIYRGEGLHDDDDAMPTPNAACCNSSDTNDGPASEKESIQGSTSEENPERPFCQPAR